MKNKKLLNLSFSQPFKMFVFLLCIATGFFIIKYTPLRGALYDSEWVRNSLLESANPRTILVFIFGGGFLTVFGFPRLLLSFIGGFVYGAMNGTFYALIGTVWGCFLSYYFAKYFASDFIRRYISGKAVKIEELLLVRPLYVSILIRNLPLANNSITNLIAGVSRIKPFPYFAGSMVGYLPQTMIFALMGSGISHNVSIQVITSLVIFVTTIGFVWYLIHVFRSGDG